MRALFACMALLGLSAPVEAQTRREREDTLALARVATSEAGLLASDDEIAALHAVLRSRTCDGCTLETVARLYSSRAFSQERRDPRAWVAWLDADGDAPRFWPSVASWEAFRPQWLRILDVAGRVVRGELTHACTETPRHWGGRVDRARAARMRLERIECGDTRNDFYRLPTRGES